MSAAPERVLFVIPARGGSKGLPRKNLLPIGGIPLVARAVLAAASCADLGPVVVSTDDDEIAAVAAQHGAIVVNRPTELSSDEASSESALVHALDVHRAEGRQDPHVCVLVQCTSPFIAEEDLRGPVELVLSGRADTAFTAAPSHAFLWTDGSDGAVAVNHDARSRQRRQDRPAEYRETGAVYAMLSEGLRTHGSRFFGTTHVHVVPPERAIEIDDRADYELAATMGSTFRAATLGPIDAIVFDFDGVMTDDTALLSDDGHESVRVSRADGMGIEMLRDAGVPMLVLSKEKNPVVARRAAKLSIDCIHGCDDKPTAMQEWLDEIDVPPDRAAYVGNDVNDRECLLRVGHAVVVPDAHPSLFPLAEVILQRRGGAGAVRELAELILGARASRS